MATSGEIAEIFSSELAMTLGAVQYYAQTMRNAGLIAKGGRGPAARHLSVTDVSNWILALCISETATAAVDEVPITRAIPLDIQTSDIRKEVIGSLSIGKASNAGDAIEALLWDMIDGRFARWQEQEFDIPQNTEGWERGILRPAANVEFVVAHQEVTINLMKPSETGKLRRASLRFVRRDSMFNMNMRKVLDWQSPSAMSSITRINRVASRAFERVADALRATDDEAIASLK